MVDHQRIFEECIRPLKLGNTGGATSLTVVREAFVCMRRRLQSAGATEDDRRAFAGVLETAIQEEPGFASDRYQRDKADLIALLHASFADVPCDVSETLAVKLNFLDRVRF